MATKSTSTATIKVSSPAPTPAKSTPVVSTPAKTTTPAKVTTPVVSTPAKTTTPTPTVTAPKTSATPTATVKAPTPTASASAPASSYTGVSVVDYLSSVGKSSDFNSRAQLAAQAGIQNYTGSASQNTQLLNSLRSGGSSSAPSTSAPSNGKLDVMPGTEQYYNADGTLKAGVNPDDVPGYYGAAGRGEWDLTPEQSAQLEAGMAEGVPASEFGDFLSDPTYRIPTLDYGQAQDLVKYGGLKGLGINASEFVGLTAGAAERKKQDIKNRLMGDLNANTSAVFDATKLSKVKDITKQLNFGLKDTLNDPFNSKDTKIAKKDQVLDTTASDIAKLFDNPDTFKNTYSTNKEFQQYLKDFAKAGGTIAQIESKIKADAQSKLPNQIDVADYLSDNKFKPKNIAEADASLEPERAYVQDEINRGKQNVQRIKDLYTGQDGLLTQARAELDKKIKELDASVESSKSDLKAQAEASRQRNQLDANKNFLEIEDNRVKTRTYLTERLAQLGALTTSGAAPEALTNLEAKFDTAKSQVTASLIAANTSVDNELTTTIRKLEADKQERIDNAEGDYTKSKAEIAKEIAKAEADANAGTMKAIQYYNNVARAAVAKATDKADKLAQAYTKEWFRIASNGMSDTAMKKILPSVAAIKNAKKTGTKDTSLLSKDQKRQLTSAGINTGDTLTVSEFLSAPSSVKTAAIRNYNDTKKPLTAQEIRAQAVKVEKSKSKGSKLEGIDINALINSK